MNRDPGDGFGQVRKAAMFAGAPSFTAVAPTGTGRGATLVLRVFLCPRGFRFHKTAGLALGRGVPNSAPTPDNSALGDVVDGDAADVFSAG